MNNTGCYRVEWFPGMTMDQLKLMVVQAALEAHQGNRTAAARALNISIRTVTNRIHDLRKMGLYVPEPE